MHIPWKSCIRKMNIIMFTNHCDAIISKQEVYLN